MGLRLSPNQLVCGSNPERPSKPNKINGNLQQIRQDRHDRRDYIARSRREETLSKNLNKQIYPCVKYRTAFQRSSRWNKFSPLLDIRSGFTEIRHCDPVRLRRKWAPRALIPNHQPRGMAFFEKGEAAMNKVALGVLLAGCVISAGPTRVIAIQARPTWPKSRRWTNALRPRLTIRRLAALISAETSRLERKPRSPI